MKRYNLISVFNQTGFTLLEILIAITLLAFITIAVVNVTDDAAQTKERTTEINENNLQIETALSRFEWDFSQIYSPLYFSTILNMNPSTNSNNSNSSSDTQELTKVQNNPAIQQYYENLISRFERNEHFRAVSKEGIPIPRFYNPEKSVFEFFTSSNRRKIENQKQSHFAWVKYALADQEQTEEEEKNTELPKNLKSFVRYFDASDPFSEKRINTDGTNAVKGAILLRNVETLEFQFWDYQKKKWETSIRSIQNGESLIRGIKLTLVWYDNFATKKMVTRIFRTNWPMVTPKDPVVLPNSQTSGNTQAVQQ